MHPVFFFIENSDKLRLIFILFLITNLYDKSQTKVPYREQYKHINYREQYKNNSYSEQNQIPVSGNNTKIQLT